MYRYRNTDFHDGTSITLAKVLNKAIENHTMVEIVFGDPQTGRIWKGSTLVCHLRRSMSSLHYVLQVKKGAASVLSDDCILEISEVKQGGRSKTRSKLWKKGEEGVFDIMLNQIYYWFINRFKDPR
jgi:hypothetical protein